MRATFSSNQKTRANRYELARFPALYVNYCGYFEILIGSLYCVCPL